MQVTIKTFSEEVEVFNEAKSIDDELKGFIGVECETMGGKETVYFNKSHVKEIEVVE
ncbi:MAG: hypothetical protein ACOCQA_02520 [bacterium]